MNFAFEQKKIENNGFDAERDKMIVVFDADIFEEKVQGYDELIQEIQKSDIAAVTNPGFELFLILHEEDSFEKYISGHECEFLSKDENGGYHHAYDILRDITGMNAKKEFQYRRFG